MDPQPGNLDVRALLASPGGGWRGLSEQLADHPGREAAIAELVRIAESDPEVDVRYKAKKTLGALGALAPVAAAPRETWALAYAGDADGVADPKLEALAQRVHARDAAAIDELLAYLPTLKDPVVLCAGLSVIARCGQASVVGELKRYLGHESPRVVASAVEAMGKLDSDAALPLVLPVLMKDDNRVRANVLMVLYRINKPEVLAYVARMAAKFEESYRASALWCLTQLADEDTEEILVSMLAREDSPELLDREAELLGRVGTRRAVTALAQLPAQDTRRAVAQRAIAAICARLGEAPPDLTAEAAPAGIGGRLKRITRKVLALGRSATGMQRPASRAIPVLAPEEPPPARWRPAVLAAAAALVALGLSVRGGSAPLADPAPSRAAVTLASAPAAKPKPGGVLAVEGRVKSHHANRLVLRQDYQHYAIALPEGRAVPQLAEGARVRVTGTYAGWDTLHGVVRIDGRSVEVRQ